MSAPVSAAHAQGSAARAVALMAAGAALLSASDATTKYLTEAYPVGQILCLRHVATLLVMLPYIAWVGGWRHLRVHSWTGQIGRGALFVASAALMVLSLGLLPLTTVTAIVFSSPVLIALLSLLVLRERVSARRWLAVALGLAGVLAIVRPGGAAFQWALLVPIAAAFVNALRDIVTRTLARNETSLAILFWSTTIVMMAGAATVPLGWRPLTGEALLWFAAAGAFNAGAHFLMIESLRVGEASLVAPVRYTTLLWATILGIAIWQETVGLWTVLGMALIVAGGVAAVGRPRSGWAHGSRA